MDVIKKDMTCDEQLEEWVKGNNIHNSARDECCPDFSCCQDQFSATLEERRAFKEHPEVRESMLMSFLGKLIATIRPDSKVHVVGETDTDTVIH